MTDPGPVAARASLDVARAALGRMMSAGLSPDAKTPPVTMAVRAGEAWAAVEHVLHNVTGRVELGGRALLAEARRQERLTIDDVHALVELSDRVERMNAAGSAAQSLTLPPTDAEREAASHALAALERAVATVGGGPSTLSPWAAPEAPVTATEKWAPLPTTTAPAIALPEATQPFSPYVLPAVQQPVSPPPRGNAPPPAHATSAPTLERTRAPSAIRQPAPAGTGRIDPNQTASKPSGLPPDLTAANGRGSARSSGMIMVGLFIVVALISGGTWYWLRNRNDTTASAGTSSIGNAVGLTRGSSLTDDGVAAYTRGALGAARIALAKALEQNPKDVRALIYLGRISREQGDAVLARKYLDAAIKLEPENALALRELGSALLADDQPELARRFYVHALTVDGTDRVSQGFLACALQRLNRTDEAQRWLNRAGPGDWTACATPAVQR